MDREVKEILKNDFKGCCTWCTVILSIFLILWLVEFAYEKVRNIPEFVVEKWAEIEMKKDSIKQDLEQQKR